MGNLKDRLRASVAYGAVCGNADERAVCEKQMMEAAQLIEVLEMENRQLNNFIRENVTCTCGPSAKPMCKRCMLTDAK